jgi:hypothetical protein
VTTKDSNTVIIAEGNIRANETLWPLGRPSATAQHEWGHHLGNPDEYSPQHVSSYNDPDGLVNGLDDNSIMGRNKTNVKKRHYGASGGSPGADGPQRVWKDLHLSVRGENLNNFRPVRGNWKRRCKCLMLVLTAIAIIGCGEEKRRMTRTSTTQPNALDQSDITFELSFKSVAGSDLGTRNPGSGRALFW